jgi:hypothetical protein
MLALLALSTALAGCGESIPTAGALRPVKGKVVFSKPEALAGLKLQLVPKSMGARPASGDIGPDGSFALASPDGEGAHEGDYGVRLDRPGGFPGGKFHSPISQEYFDEDGAFLTARVGPDTTELPPIELRPIAGPSSKRPR